MQQQACYISSRAKHSNVHAPAPCCCCFQISCHLVHTQVWAAGFKKLQQIQLVMRKLLLRLLLLVLLSVVLQLLLVLLL